MRISRLIVLVEEMSAQALLEALLPKMAPDLTFNIHPYQGKDDLLAKLPDRLRAFGRYLTSEDGLLVLLDRDGDDCEVLKAQMETIAKAAGLSILHANAPVAKKAGRATVQVVNRIAIEELEAWYFGDWEAVCQVYPRVSRDTCQRSNYRHPDAIRGGTCEAFTRILQRSGYRLNHLPKIATAQAMAAHMDPNRNTSPSFQCLHRAILAFVQNGVR